METINVELDNEEVVELGMVGPSDGNTVLYFHSPSTAGEELDSATDAADRVGVRLVTVRRPSVASRGADFLADVADTARAAVDFLGYRSVALMAWSGGAPYALATASREAAPPQCWSSVHLVSPLPGPLRGPNAVPGLSERLRRVADTSDDSPWVTGPATRRDYDTVADEWHFDLDDVRCPVTVWASTADDIVPPRLARALANRLGRARVEIVTGSHDWLLGHWDTVLAGCNPTGGTVSAER